MTCLDHALGIYDKWQPKYQIVVEWHVKILSIHWPHPVPTVIIVTEMGDTPSTVTSSTSTSASSSSSSTTTRQPGGPVPPVSSSSTTAAPSSSGATTVTGSSDQPRTATVLIPGPPGGRAMFRPPGAELVEPVDPHLPCHSRFFLGRRQPDVSYFFTSLCCWIWMMNVCITHTFIYKLCCMLVIPRQITQFSENPTCTVSDVSEKNTKNTLMCSNDTNKILDADHY